MKFLPFLLLLLINMALVAQDYTLGVMYFDTSTSIGSIDDKDKDSLSLALTEMIISDLSALQVLTLVERENLQKILDEQKLGLTGFLDESTTAQIGELLGTKYLLTGSLIFTGKLITMSSRIVVVESGEIIASKTVNGQIHQIFSLQEELVEELMIQWDIPLSRKEWGTLAKRENITLDGLIQLGNALDANDSKDYEKALTYLTKAITLSPDFSLALSLKNKIQKRFDTYLNTLDKDLPHEIITKIDDLANGDKGAVQEATKMYWAFVQPLMMGMSYYGTLYSVDEAYRGSLFNDYFKNQMKLMGFKDDEYDLDHLEDYLGRKIYKAYGILEYLLDKNIPMEGFNEYMHPVEGAMGYFLTMFASISSSPEWKFPPMLDNDGKVIMTQEQYYPVLLSYCDMFITNFPYSAYSGMVSPMMLALLEKNRDK